MARRRSNGREAFALFAIILVAIGVITLAWRAIQALEQSDTLGRILGGLGLAGFVISFALPDPSAGWMYFLASIMLYLMGLTLTRLPDKKRWAALYHQYK